MSPPTRGLTSERGLILNLKSGALPYAGALPKAGPILTAGSIQRTE